MPSLALLIALLLCCALTGCISPWAVMEGGFPDFTKAMLPPGTERIEVPVGDGAMLRGVFVPGEPGAPVVLHVLEAKGSVTLGCAPEVAELGHCGFPVLWDLQELGYASVMLDYRGVGASSGDRHVDHLLDDTRAMWNEAVRRVGGDASLVVLRTVSLGAVGSGPLVTAGLHPAAWILFAPVDGATVASNVLYANLWSPIAWLADCLATNVSDSPLLPALAAGDFPLLCYLPREPGDAFLTAEEHAQICAAVEARKGQCVKLNPEHISCAGGGHWLRPEERRLLGDLFGTIAPVDARVAAALATGGPSDADDPRTMARLRLLGSAVNAPPALLLAGARSTVPPSAMLPWVSWLGRRAFVEGTTRTLAQWQETLQLDDVSGPLRADLIARLAPWLLAHDQQQGPLDESALIEPMLAGDSEGVFERYYPTHRTEDFRLGGLMMHALTAAGGMEGANARHWPRRATRTLTKARGKIGGEPAPPDARWAGSSPWLRSSLEDIGNFAAMPPALAGLQRELLWDVFTTSLPEDAFALRAAAVDHAVALRAALAENPHYCDVPALIVASFATSADGTFPAWPLSWIARHAAYLTTVPWHAQLILAQNWQSLSKKRAPELHVVFAEWRLLTHPDNDLCKPPQERLADYAALCLPARTMPDPWEIEVWRHGHWCPRLVH